MPVSRIAGLRTRVRPFLLGLRLLYFRRIWGMDIGEGCHISFSARLDKTNPHGIHIGDQSIVTFGATILSHDFVNNRHLDTRIGRWCFIGAHSIILPGVEIGDHSIVAAGSVVVRSVPPHSLVGGNPARIIEAEIETGPYGMRGEAWAKTVAGKQ
jgi:acetyltransferase-like isoleucine patch superfamily enzyme